LIGSAHARLPSPLPPGLAQGTRSLIVERPPVEADPPLEELAPLPFPKLVVSGGHSAAFDAVCGVVAERLGAERAAIAGAGHSVPRTGAALNEMLETFLGRARIRFPIETERLLLRPFRHDDAEPLHAIWGNPAAARFGGAYRRPETVEDTRRYLVPILAGQAERGYASWAVVERAGGRLIGDCGLFPADDAGPDVELAYGLAPDVWGRGYATEAARASLRAGFEELGLERVVADVDPSNRASVRVLEKLGMRPVGRKDDTYLLYAVARA
jgi:ribosomal-protein-alanine N-acetyltransferase